MVTELNTETCEDTCWQCGDGIERFGRGWQHCEDVLPTDCTWGNPYCPHCGTEHEGFTAPCLHFTAPCLQER